MSAAIAADAERHLALVRHLWRSTRRATAAPVGAYELMRTAGAEALRRLYDQTLAGHLLGRMRPTCAPSWRACGRGSPTPAAARRLRARGRRRGLAAALAAARREVAELRASQSWRLTAPLRASTAGCCAEAGAAPMTPVAVVIACHDARTHARRAVASRLTQTLLRPRSSSSTTARAMR